VGFVVGFIVVAFDVGFVVDVLIARQNHFIYFVAAVVFNGGACIIGGHMHNWWCAIN